MRSANRARLWCVALALACAAALPSTASSAATPYYHEGSLVLGGGFNNPVGETHPYLNSSGTIFFGVGRNPSDKFGFQVEYTHNWLAISEDVLQHAQSDSVQLTDAQASMWSMTLNGVYRIHPQEEYVPWLTGGFGYYKRNVILTQNSLVYYPPVWDPWWGWIDGGWGPGESVAGRRSDSGFGFNVGGGIDMAVESGLSLFIDVRYHHAFLDGVDMQLVPIMFGVRW